MADKKEESKPAENPPPKTSTANPDFRPIGSTTRIENNETTRMDTNLSTDKSDAG
jgi:hypothetical protein